jgi:predicted ester cyclase
MIWHREHFDGSHGKRVSSLESGEAVNPANESVVRRFFEELWNAGDLAVADDIVAPHHMHHIGEDVRHGPEGVRQMVSYLRAAFPDLHFVLEDLLSDADRVAVRWTATGTQTGPFFELQPTGRHARWTGMDMVRLEDRLLVELWANADGAALWEQLTESPEQI